MSNLKTVTLDPAAEAALTQLLKTASNKAKKSQWWAERVAPLASLIQQLQPPAVPAQAETSTKPESPKAKKAG